MSRSTRRATAALIALATLGLAVIPAGARVTLHQGPYSAVFGPPTFTSDTASGPSEVCPDRVVGRMTDPGGTRSVVIYQYDATRLTYGGFPARPRLNYATGLFHYLPPEGSDDEFGDPIPVLARTTTGPTYPVSQNDTFWGPALEYAQVQADFEAKLPAGVPVGATLMMQPTYDDSPHYIVVVDCRPPVATDGSFATSAGAAVDVDLEATDPDGDPLDYEIVDGPDHGTLGGTAPALTYTPDDGFAGSDSFTFRATDGQFWSNVATVEIDVAAATVDTVSVRVSGGFTYEAAGPAVGPGFDVGRDGLGANRLTGWGRVDGTDPRALVKVELHRVLFWTFGTIDVRDPGAGLPPIGSWVLFGPSLGSGNTLTARGTGVWLDGSGLRTYRIEVSVTDT